MPNLKVLDIFKTLINAMGDEPRLLAERGETLSEVTPADSLGDSDLEQLLSDETIGGVNEMEALLGSYTSGDSDADFNSDFGDFNLDDFNDPEIPDIPDRPVKKPAEQRAEEDLSAADEDFSLDDLSMEDPLGGSFPVDESEAGEVRTEDFSSLDDLFPDQSRSGTQTEPVSEDLGSDDFSLDNLDFGEAEAPDSTAYDMPEDEGFGSEIFDDIAGVGKDAEAAEVLEDLDPGELDASGDLDIPEYPASSPETEMPDIGSAVEGLGGIESVSESGADELSLDEELNFDEELGAHVFTDIRDAGDTSPQFSMEDFGDQYNFNEKDAGIAENLRADLDTLEKALDEEAVDHAKVFSLDESDFLSIRQTLSGLPRNLKIAIEELLADERKTPEDFKILLDALISGESARVLAAKYKTITRRTIELPRSYEKRSGFALEQQRASVVYKLVSEGWPVARIVLLVISIAWISGAAAFMWVYRPLKADSLYRKGLEAITVDDLAEADRYFFDAWDGWPLFQSEGTDRIADAPIVVKGWKDKDRWLDYARSMRRRKHWTEARTFYEGYLRVEPGSKDTRLEYAGFLSKVLGEYQLAIDVLENAPVRGSRRWDRDYTLAAGDVYMDWAEDDPAKYEEARFRYAKVLETSRNDEQAILSMMRYHLRLNDEKEIDRLRPVFDNEKPGKTDVPELAARVYSGLARYLLARDNMKEARRFIDLARGADPLAPEPSFVDALFWRKAGDDRLELEAFKRTLVNLEGRESLTRIDLEIRILTLGGIGRIQADKAIALSSSPPDAAEALSLATINYSKAIELFEDARGRNQIGVSPDYAKLYLELGDILYLGVRTGGDLSYTLVPNLELLAPGNPRYKELQQAELYYNEAEVLFGKASGATLPPVSLYRRGYARYVLNEDDALLDFHRVARIEPENYEARIALGTVLLDGGDFEASRSQYARAIELMEAELRRSGGILNPDDRGSHVELLLRFIVAWNNLGVGRARSAARGGGEEDYSAALSAFTMASEYHDEVFVDMDALTSRGAIGMRDLEERRVVSEVDGRNLLLEKTSYPYINRLRLLGLDKADTGVETYLQYKDIPSELIPGDQS
jgi:tetratricopeptide (TPR) repeat protein